MEFSAKENHVEFCPGVNRKLTTAPGSGLSQRGHRKPVNGGEVAVRLSHHLEQPSHVGRVGDSCSKGSASLSRTHREAPVRLHAVRLPSRRGWRVETMSEKVLDEKLEVWGSERHTSL